MVGKNRKKNIGLAVGLLVILGGLSCRIVRIESSVESQTTDLSGTRRGMPVRIVAQAIDLDAPVVEMGWYATERWGEVDSEWDVPENEAGWHRNSAVPGRGSNVVISGHNNSMAGRVFANLEALTVGDRITIWNDDGTSFEYQVRDKQLVRALGASSETRQFLQRVIQPTSSEQLTLITCWPNWTNTHRLIIVADPHRS